MPIDRREMVLSRVFAILNGISGFVTKQRNRGLVVNDKLPGVVLLDGDERTNTLAGGRGRVRMSASIVTMQPQIFILMDVRKPANTLVGEDLNLYRGEIIRAIANDEELLALIGTNGKISYDGCETDLKSGMPMDGQMLLNFSITTVMDPNR